MAETEAIKKFDVNDAADRLKGKIRDAFIELLTEEQFKDMVLTELKSFTQGGSKYEHHLGRHVQQPSEFSKLCRGVFEEYVKSELKKLLDSPEYQTQWGNGDRMQISDAVQGWLTKHRRELIETTVLTFAGNAAQHMLENLRNNLPGRF